MKPIVYTLFVMGLLVTASCNGDDDLKKGPAQNTWVFESEYNVNGGATTYEAQNVTLNIQGYAQLTAVSKTRYDGGYGGTNSTVIIYFKSMPLADKEYKITSYSSVAAHDDEVAILINISGDSEIPGSGGGGSPWQSEGDGSQKLIYKFSDSKGSAEFNDVTLFNGTHAGKKSAQASAKISQ